MEQDSGTKVETTDQTELNSYSNTPDGDPISYDLEELCRYQITNNSKKGIFAVFNHGVFTVDDLGKRNGTEADAKKIKSVWTKLGFLVEIHNDLGWMAIKKKIKEYASDDYHKNYDMFICAVLTHGDKGDFVYASDHKYPVNELFEPFQECKSLVGKPKLFFIQACRGTKLDDGNESRYSKGVKEVEADTTGFNLENMVKIPKEADFLIAYSTPAGYYAWRNAATGSWFIQTLCTCIENYAEKWDLMTILTQVNRKVSERKSDAKGLEGKMQCPSIVSRLTGLLYLCQMPAWTESVDGLATKLTPEKTEDRKLEIEKQEYHRLKVELMTKKMEVLKLKEKLCQKKLKERGF